MNTLQRTYKIYNSCVSTLPDKTTFEVDRHSNLLLDSKNKSMS